MICDFCHQREATFFVEQTSKTGKRKLHFCAECVKERGFSTDPKEISKALNSLFTEFFTLCSPGRDTWFFKAIIAAYIISFFSFKYIKSEKFRFLVIFSCVFAYIVVMSKLGYGRWWFNSILNFPVGMLVARWYDKIDAIPDLLVIIASFCIYFFLHYDIVRSIGFSFVIVFAVKYINIRSSYLYFVGYQSLAFYFLENPVRRFICNPYVENYWLLVFSSIVVTSVFVLVYSKLDSKILKNS